MWAHRLPSLRRTLALLDPEMLYTRGFSLFAPAVAGAARTAGTAYMAALACDDDLRTTPLGGGSAGIAHFFGYGKAARSAFIRGALEKADIVLAQHSGQLSACADLGLSAVLLRNAFVSPVIDAAPRGNFDIAWIGHISPFKGFDRLVGMLGHLRGMKIAIVGSVQGAANQGLLARAITFPGVEYLGELRHEEAMGVLRSSSILLNTSPAEGFSNAFLEAWHLGRPVVSLSANPDGLLSGSAPFGFCGRGDPNATAEAAVSLAGDPAAVASMGSMARVYVAGNHGLELVVDSLEEISGKIRPGRRSAS